ncbi:hypothetical protein L1887_57354 [Cichorium endivia]|nr:hypothetical protein L1887_57354 [Cichorium endivia]
MLSLRQPVFKGGACNYVMAAGEGAPAQGPSSPRSWPLRTALRRIRPFFSFLKKNRVNADDTLSSNARAMLHDQGADSAREFSPSATRPAMQCRSKPGFTSCIRGRNCDRAESKPFLIRPFNELPWLQACLQWMRPSEAGRARPYAFG